MAAWAGLRLGKAFVPPYEAWGVTNKAGQIIGAVVFNDYDGRNVEITVVGKGAWSRGVVREIGKHCFEALNCRRVSFTTRQDNWLVQSLVERMGGIWEGRKRDYYDDCDAVFYGILKDEFKYGNR